MKFIYIWAINLYPSKAKQKYTVFSRTPANALILCILTIFIKILKFVKFSLIEQAKAL